MTARLAPAPALVLLLASALLAAQAPYKYLRLGHPADVHVATRGGFALIGGGTDLDSAFQWMCARSGGGDFLILRASGTDAYNPYVQKLCPDENSVATLILPNRAASSAPFVAQAIARAAAIFIAGGDQSNYINFWKGTAVERGLDAAIRRGVPIGGTSAGLAVLGQFAYSAQGDRPGGPDLTAAAALANPFNPQVVIVRNFLAIPPLRGVIADTHFHNRNRLGRLVVFMARILADGDAPGGRVHGIGIDQHTALLVDPDGHAVAAGTGAVYLFAAAAKPAICRPGVPLTFAGIAVQKLAAGQAFDLDTWTGAGAAYTLSADAGTLRSTQPGGSVY